MHRYRGTEINEDYFPVDVGDYYLILVSPQEGDDYYELRDQPGRTNLSREARTSGWLGETNNVNRYARGCVRVAKDARGRLRIRKITVAQMHAGEECAAVGS